MQRVLKTRQRGLGLSGSHRTGKTTLAKMFSETSGFQFAQTTTSKVFSDMGYDPKVDYPFDIRVDIQQQILIAAEEVYRSISGPFVSDRTPLDMLAYTLADVTRQNVTPALADKIVKYTANCHTVLNRYFTNIVIVQPGIPLKEEEGKASIEVSYMEHHSALVIGLAFQERVVPDAYLMSRDLIGLEERLDFLEDVVYNIVRPD